MLREADKKRRSIALLRELAAKSTELLGEHADGMQTIDRAGFTARALWAGCISKAKAIAQLLKHGHADESSILIRSLQSDAHRLAFASQQGDRSAEWLLRVINLRAGNIERFAGAARDSSQGHGIDGLRVLADQHHELVRNEMKRLGLSKLPKFPAEGKAMAMKLGRPDDLIDYVASSMAVHGSLSGMGFSPRMGDDGIVQISIQSDSPELAVAIAGRASRYVQLATVSSLEIVGSAVLEAAERMLERLLVQQIELEGTGESR